MILSIAVVDPRPARAGAQERAPASSETPALSPAGRSFAIGNVLFALVHEFGHTIIRDFDVPLQVP